MVSNLMGPGWGDQWRQPFDQFALFHQDVGGAVAPGDFELQRELPVAALLESFARKRRPGNVAVESLEAPPVPGRYMDFCVEAHAAVLGYSSRCFRIRGSVNLFRMTYPNEAVRTRMYLCTDGVTC